MAGLTKKSPNEQKIRLQESDTEQVINNKGVKKHRVKGKGKKDKNYKENPAFYNTKEK